MSYYSFLSLNFFKKRNVFFPFYQLQKQTSHVFVFFSSTLSGINGISCACTFVMFCFQLTLYKVKSQPPDDEFFFCICVECLAVPDWPYWDWDEGNLFPHGNVLNYIVTTNFVDLFWRMGRLNNVLVRRAKLCSIFVLFFSSDRSCCWWHRFNPAECRVQASGCEGDAPSCDFQVQTSLSGV